MCVGRESIPGVEYSVSKGAWGTVRTLELPDTSTYDFLIDTTSKGLFLPGPELYWWCPVWGRGHGHPFLLLGPGFPRGLAGGRPGAIEQHRPWCDPCLCLTQFCRSLTLASPTSTTKASSCRHSVGAPSMPRPKSSTGSPTRAQR